MHANAHYRKLHIIGKKWVHTNLASWEFLKESIRFVCLSKNKIGSYLNFSTGIFGCNKGLISAEILRVCVQCLQQRIYSIIRINRIFVENALKIWLMPRIIMMIDDFYRTQLLTPAIFALVRREKRRFDVSLLCQCLAVSLCACDAVRISRRTAANAMDFKSSTVCHKVELSYCFTAVFFLYSHSLAHERQ